VTRVLVSGGFDDLRSSQVRFLQEAARLGDVNVLLWSDELVKVREDQPPRFPLEERLYLLGSLRYVEKVLVVNGFHDAQRQVEPSNADLWVTDHANLKTCVLQTQDQDVLNCRVVGESDLAGFPLEDPSGGIKKKAGEVRVMVTGSFDWLHSGHIRFFEEASSLGDLYVVVGHDANIALLKGEGHPMFPQDERRYMVQAVRFVKATLISSGHGWMDAEPEVEIIRPDLYMVNEDGDRPEKFEFCREHGIEYRVLRRMPKDGLPKRESTRLRGF
jgi:cytidyltransferase-like protein